MKHTVARMLSIVGHPALLMPASVVGAALDRGVPRSVLVTAAGASLFIAAVVGAYSLVKVRAGAWRHMDASEPRERLQLNRFVIALLGATALLGWAGGLPRAIVLGLVLSALIVAFAHGLRGRLKTSLHAAFAVFAAAVVWPNPVAAAVVLGLALGVAWSRCVLGRHTVAEAVVGLLAGALGGVGLHGALG